MTRRTHFFPRIDIREVPMRPRGSGTWAADWARACARAATVKEPPSQYQGIARTIRSAGLDGVIAERRRKGEVFEP